MRWRALWLVVMAALVAFGVSAAAVYPNVERGYQIQFPRDEGSHSQFKT